MIKAGWSLEVTSWENDGDCYNTERFEGLFKEEVQWRVNVLKALMGRPQYHRQDDLDREDYLKLASYLPNDMLEDVSFEVDEDEGYCEVHDVVSDVVHQMIGSPYEAEGTRVVESYKVHYIPFDIPEATNLF